MRPGQKGRNVTEALYLHDAYLRRFEATVTAVTPGGILLDRTAFYPQGGGQPADSGQLTPAGGTAVRVAEARKTPEGILHVIGDPSGWTVGQPVVGEIDWDRRLSHMRHHTALHLLSGVVFRRVGSGITGSQIYDDRARMDLSVPDFDRSVADSFISGVNDVVREARPVTVRFLPREEAMKDPTLVRVAQELLPDVAVLRLIDIEGFDVQADGGTHVGNTREVGTVRLEKIENKGARNKRLYVSAGGEGPSTDDGTGSVRRPG